MTCAVLKCFVRVVISLIVNMARAPGSRASNISIKGIFFWNLKTLCSTHEVGK